VYAKEEEYEVTVLSRDEVTTFPTPATPVEQVLVTYVAAGLPPATITIVKAEYTKAREQELIKADIQRRLKMVPETYKV